MRRIIPSYRYLLIIGYILSMGVVTACTPVIPIKVEIIIDETASPQPPTETPIRSATAIITPASPASPTATTSITEPISTPIATASEATPQPGAAGIGDVFYPNQGNGGYDALNYVIDLSVDMSGSLISGTTSMTATAIQNLSRFNLDFGGPEVSQVIVNGQPAVFERDEVELIITPDQPLEEGENFTTRISYSGEPGVGIPERDPEFSSGWSFYDEGVLVAGEPSSR